MKLLILSASPKKKGGASRFFSRLFRLFLPGVRKEAAPLSCRQDFQQILELFPDMDAVCLFVPLYVDSLPSHVVEFLIQAEEYCKSHPCRFRLYAFSNNGFVEGKQNRPALHMLQAWCKRAGIIWRRDRSRRRGDASDIGDRLPDPNWNHPVANGVILFQHRHRFRRIVAFPCYPDIHMDFSQQRRVVLYDTSFVSDSQGANGGRPIYAGHDTLLAVYPHRGRIYDFIFSLSRPLSFRTFAAGQMA